MMTAAAVCLIAASVIWAAGPIAALSLWISASFDRRAEDKRRAEQGRTVDAEWLAVLAATEETPIYDRLMCESIEREEWPA